MPKRKSMMSTWLTCCICGQDNEQADITTFRKMRSTEALCTHCWKALAQKALQGVNQGHASFCPKCCAVRSQGATCRGCAPKPGRGHDDDTKASCWHEPTRTGLFCKHEGCGIWLTRHAVSRHKHKDALGAPLPGTSRHTISSLFYYPSLDLLRGHHQSDSPTAEQSLLASPAAVTGLCDCSSSTPSYTPFALLSMADLAPPLVASPGFNSHLFSFQSLNLLFLSYLILYRISFSDHC